MQTPRFESGTGGLRGSKDATSQTLLRALGCVFLTSALAACGGASSGEQSPTDSQTTPPPDAVADPVDEQPKLLSLTPDAAMAGGNVVFVAQSENTQYFRMWATKNGDRAGCCRSARFRGADSDT